MAGAVGSRRDVVRNREKLVAAARLLLTDHGPSVAFDDIAQSAGVSRTTLHRHFASRDDLLLAVFESNVARIENRATELVGDDRGLLELFDFCLDLQFEAPALTRALSHRKSDEFEVLSARTAAAFLPHLATAETHGLLNAGVDVRDVMLALPMAGGAIIEFDLASRPRDFERVRAMLHRSLFTLQSVA